MNYTTQQVLRFVSPGIAVAVGLSAFLSSKSPGDFFATFEMSLKSFGAPLLAVLVVGALYWSVAAQRLRRWIFRRSAGRIMQRLSVYAEQRGVHVGDPTDSVFRKCLQNKWYRIIDSDSQLKTKSEAIRLNGTVTTSAFEAGVVGGVFALLFTFSSHAHRGQWAALFVGVAGLAALTFSLSRGNHVKLVDEQIDIAERHFGREIAHSVQDCGKARAGP